MSIENDNNIRWLPLREIMPNQIGARIDSKKLRNLTLVLSARNIQFKLFPENNPEEIYIPETSRDIACHEINLFLAENGHPEPEKNNIVPADNIMVSLIVLLLLGIFHNLTYFQMSGFGHNSIDWLHLGNANSSRILEGEWWRAITALTLHTDGQHLMGNILIGGYFIVRLCQWTGTGLGWCLILGSGIAGNLLNAIVQGSGHNAVGASTAIFGAIGIAGTLGSVQSRRHMMRRWSLPLAAAGILLAFLGSGAGDSHTDVGAHLFGFFCGVVLGIPAGLFIVRKGAPKQTGNTILAILAALLPTIGWLLALLM